MPSGVLADAVTPEQLEDDGTDCKLVVHLDYVQVCTRRKGEGEKAAE